jgi:hypothetical protein
VGLSGSSAIVVATFRSLLKFNCLTIADLGISKQGKLVISLIISKKDMFPYVLVLTWQTIVMLPFLRFSHRDSQH